jgi:aminoglycoside 3-N-acetyltransferase
MEAQQALEWITEVFAIRGRLLRTDDTRDSIPEWDSLGTLELQSRLREDHGITVGDEELAKLETVRQICQLLEQGSAPSTRSSTEHDEGKGPSRRAKKPHLSRLAAMGREIASGLSSRQKSRLRAVHKGLSRTFRSYSPRQLLDMLRSMGVAAGDTLLVHSSFRYSNGFSGSPEQVIDVLLEAVGSQGNLMMMSLPYTSSTYDYLRTLDVFDVRKTVSQMGLLTEIFRERADVRRSLSPTHPILACGPGAETIVAGHEECAYPCGAGSPFEKLARLEGKVLFFDAPFASLTFFHYIEDMYRDRLPYALYHPEAFEVPVVDHAGRRLTVFVYAFSPEIIERRRPYEFEAEVRKQGLIRSTRIGNTRLEYIEVKPLLNFVGSRVRLGDYFFYDLA